MTRSLSLSPDRRLWLAAGLPLSLMALVACDPPRRKSEPPKPPAESVQPAEEQIHQAGGLPPRTTVPAVATAPEPESYATLEDAYTAGLAAWKKGEFRRAEKLFDRAIALDGTHAKSFVNSARVLLDQGRDQEALERVEKALTLEPSSIEALRVKARALGKIGSFDEAIAIYRHALVLDEQDVWTLNNLGMLYLDLGDPDAALGPLARAVQLKSTAPVFQNNLGIALERDGYLIAARTAFEAALRADSTYGKAKVNLTRVSALVTDSTTDQSPSLKKVAELFRQEVAMWRDSVGRPVVKPDSM